MIFDTSTARPTERPTARPRGFTLIEVMVVVAIIGILAALAYPSYAEYVKRGRRAKAQTALLEAAQYMQRFYAANNRYDQDLSNTTLTADTVKSKALTNTQELAYDLSLTATATGFTLTASPTTGGLMAGDKCGSFTLDQTGMKNVTSLPTGSTVTPKDCWK
jgi:type IV pilus assembly protein PilE